ncbi:beta-carotene hydroxylase 2, chloroplastic-like isoform X2 [Primulina eburnea]|uniref:beta-carotene hydroxylase 2, chloroplastic-like isoform X2 n=1 Tax=Primulina eburnea TaxID=1245227 RepID=UPI003C6C3261
MQKPPVSGIKPGPESHYSIIHTQLVVYIRLTRPASSLHVKHSLKTPRKSSATLPEPPPMAAGMSLFTSYRTVVHFKHTPLPSTSTTTPNLIFSPLQQFRRISRFKRSKKPDLTVCFVVEEEKLAAEGLVGSFEDDSTEESGEEREKEISARWVAEKMARKRSERFTYLVAAVMSSLGITSMAVMAVYYRFAWQMEGGEVPYTEMFGTFALSFGAAVGMEFWARWAHEALWHASLWHMHEGLGITMFGIAYMFVHDGLVHKRFPVGPIANVPYFRRVASAHQLHHSEKFNGVPYGLFLGPKELEEVGGLEELEKEINRRIRLSKSL